MKKAPNVYEFFMLNQREFFAGLKPKTANEYRRLLNNHIMPKFGRRIMEHLNRHTIKRWHSSLARTTPYQANRALAVLSRLFSLALDAEVAVANPCREIKKAKEKPRQTVLEGDQIKTLLDYIGYGNVSVQEGCFLLVMLYTGARPGELAGARWDWLRGNFLNLPDSKVGERTIYLPEKALAALHPIMPAKGEPAGQIFPDVDPTLLWRRVRRACGFQGVRLYDLRHTFATAALEAGSPLEAISQLLGHSSPNTTRRYVHMMPQTGLRAATGAADTISNLAEGK